jgi:hypothetical protein
VLPLLLEIPKLGRPRLNLLGNRIAICSCLSGCIDCLLSARKRTGGGFVGSRDSQSTCQQRRIQQIAGSGDVAIDRPALGSQPLQIPVSFDQSLVAGQPFPKGGRREVGPTKRRNEGLPSILQVPPLVSKAIPLFLVSLHLGLHVGNSLSRRLQSLRTRLCSSNSLNARFRRPVEPRALNMAAASSSRSAMTVRRLARPAAA